MVKIGYEVIKPDFIERDPRHNCLVAIITLVRADRVRQSMNKIFVLKFNASGTDFMNIISDF